MWQVTFEDISDLLFQGVKIIRRCVGQLLEHSENGQSCLLLSHDDLLLFDPLLFSFLRLLTPLLLSFSSLFVHFFLLCCYLLIYFSLGLCFSSLLLLFDLSLCFKLFVLLPSLLEFCVFYFLPLLLFAFTPLCTLPRKLLFFLPHFFFLLTLEFVGCQWTRCHRLLLFLFLFLWLWRRRCVFFIATIHSFFVTIVPIILFVVNVCLFVFSFLFFFRFIRHFVSIFHPSSIARIDFAGAFLGSFSALVSTLVTFIILGSFFALISTLVTFIILAGLIILVIMVFLWLRAFPLHGSPMSFIICAVLSPRPIIPIVIVLAPIVYFSPRPIISIIILMRRSSASFGTCVISVISARLFRTLLLIPVVLARLICTLLRTAITSVVPAGLFSAVLGASVSSALASVSSALSPAVPGTLVPARF
mmetsp:Transcript_44156/g.77503  ORF Transcript_44156/g.77503 Transcript_44156/m.77503 type:complete len:417 (+) Transcript_44156:1319-2569(+)